MLKNHICFILDRSSSMETIRDATIKAFNDQLDSIAVSSRGQLTDVSLFTFSTFPDEPTFFTAPIDSLPKLSRETFKPDGWTALFDCIMLATGKLMALPDANDPNTAFLFVILSDGQENRSLCSVGDVAARIAALEATNRYTFTYLGCSAEDLKRMRNELGISVGNSRGFDYSDAGIASSSVLNCSAADSYFSARSAGATSVSNLYDQAEAKLPTFIVSPDNKVSTKLDDKDQASTT